MSTTVRLLVSLTVAAVMLTGCGISIGGGTTRHYPTKGQELADLKQAYDAGALSESEYERERSKVLRRSR